MLLFETAQNGNAIEELFCRPFGNLKKFEMPEEMAVLYITVLSLDKIDYSTVKDDDKMPIFKLIENSLKYRFSFVINDFRVYLLISSIVNNVGTAIMYLTFLQYCCKQRNTKELTLDLFNEIFANGFPSPKDLIELWKQTKISVPEGVFDSDNLIDYQSAMKSIHFTNE